MNSKQPCPCCGYITLEGERSGSYEICPVCFWEDDPTQRDDENYEGGANEASLAQARANFKKYGACEPELADRARKPNSDEMP